jgi:hypothetical protein
MQLNEIDMLNLTAAFKPLIDEAIDAALAARRKRAQKAKRRADSSNPKPPDEVGHRYSKPWAQRNRMAVAPSSAPTPSATDLEQRLDRLERSEERRERQRYQQNQEDSAFAADVAARLVQSARNSGKDDNFATVYRRVLGELHLAPQATRTRYSKQFTGLTTTPPETSELKHFSDRLTDLVKRRVEDYPGSLATERGKLVNAVFAGIPLVASFVGSNLAQDKYEVAELREIILEIRRLATNRANERARTSRIGFSSAYRQILDELIGEDLNRFHNSQGDGWQRRQLDYKAEADPLAHR